MRKWMFYVFLVLLISGCSRAGSGGYTAGDIRGINHMPYVINYMDVNGYGGPIWAHMERVVAIAASCCPINGGRD